MHFRGSTPSFLGANNAEAPFIREKSFWLGLAPEWSYDPGPGGHQAQRWPEHHQEARKEGKELAPAHPPQTEKAQEIVAPADGQKAVLDPPGLNLPVLDPPDLSFSRL